MREKKTRASADERRDAYNFCIVVAVDGTLDLRSIYAERFS